ncbi:MAG: hypothetical protein JW779_04345 [Candidatus Thorarchaeota archaeon]|nr:hypothetical protein [Candidatus Thorarchaeota archaeon]
MHWRNYKAISIAVFLSIMIIYASNEITAYNSIPSDLNMLPYVDNINFEVISYKDNRILALQAGTIDMDTSYFDPIHYDTLNSDPDIAIYKVLCNGYKHITINCRDYPLNISALRKAFAYAFDKKKLVTDNLDGFAQEHDSIVPSICSWCIEDEFSYHYYTAELDVGNAILDAAGFSINGETGFRNAPNGSAFDINIEYTSMYEDYDAIAQAAVDALTALHIDAYATDTEFYQSMSRLSTHGDYDMVVYKTNFYGNDVDWIAYQYWSEYSTTPFQNPSNFENSTYDNWRNQLLNSISYKDVYEAVAAMQEIIQYNVPILVVDEGMSLQAYRTDRFSGYVEDIAGSITGPWTMMNIHKLDGTYGGTVTVAIADVPGYFNIYTTSSPHSANILSNLYSSLYKYSPDLLPCSDLAQSMLVETHDDNIAVPAGHTRYTIDIIQNATWNDGISLTAQDIEFTFTYILGSYAYGNPAGVELDNLVSVESTSTYTVVFEFDIESYWSFSNFAFCYIIPYHIYKNTPYSSWTSSISPDVTSGPFNFDSYDEGEWYRITKNSHYYMPVNPAPIVSSVEGITYVEGTTGNVIVWEVSDDNPNLYKIYKDTESTPFVTNSWNGSDITQNVDGLSVGTYNYTLWLYDCSGNSAMSSVIVTVQPMIGSALTMIVAIGSVASILIVIVIIIRKK